MFSTVLLCTVTLAHPVLLCTVLLHTLYICACLMCVSVVAWPPRDDFETHVKNQIIRIHMCSYYDNHNVVYMCLLWMMRSC